MFGALIGKFISNLSIFSVISFGFLKPKCPPIKGALLSSDFIWWRFVVVGGESEGGTHLEN